jgi:hypothetical protein
MAMERGTWKKVGYGILAAGVGAAIFGAAHFYFLGNVPGGNLFGVPYSTLFPFVLGTLGLIGAYGFTKSEGTMRNVLLFGSAAAIGFGIADFAGWATFRSGSIGSSRASAAAYVPARPYITPTAPTMSGGTGALVIGGGTLSGGTKVV